MTQEQNNEQSENPFIAKHQQDNFEETYLGRGNFESHDDYTEAWTLATNRIRREKITDKAGKIKVYEEVKAQYREYQGYLKGEKAPEPRVSESLDERLSKLEDKQRELNERLSKLERACGKLLLDKDEQYDLHQSLVSAYYEHKAIKKFQEEHKARHPDEAFPEVIPHTETHETLLAVLEYLAKGIAFQLEEPPSFDKAIEALRENEGIITELREAVERHKEFYERLMGQGETSTDDEAE